MHHHDNLTLDVLVPFLLDAEEEILEVISRKYGLIIPGGMTGEGTARGVDPRTFSRLLIGYAADPDVRAVIHRRYRECGRVLGIVSGSHSMMGDLSGRLDDEGRAILQVLSKTGHATLNEISAVTRSSHFDVLYRLREVIIPESVRLFGRPLVTFRESGIDPLTGERVSFSWWLNDECIREPGRIEMTEGDEALTITVDMSGSGLPASMPARASFRHGILEIQVQKRELIR